MRRYAEIHRGFVIAIHERDDMRRPEFVSPRFAIRVDMLNPEPGPRWTFDGRRFSPPGPPQAAEPVVPTDRELLEQILAIVEQL